MATDQNPWVITAAQAVRDKHGLLELHLSVMKHPGVEPPASLETHVYKVAPDNAADVLDALMRVATEENPGSTEA